MAEYNYKNILSQVLECTTLDYFTFGATCTVPFHIPLLLPLTNSKTWSGGSIGHSQVINDIPEKITGISNTGHIMIKIPFYMTEDLVNRPYSSSKGMTFYMTFVNADIKKPIILRRGDDTF
jgi:hypothetical protein